jgi:hydrogenase maturation protease
MDATAGRSGTVVIGIGNEYRRDDAVGSAVVTALAERGARRPLPGGTSLRMSDGEPTHLVSLWENARLAVVVDAARVRPAVPGRVHRLEPADGRYPPTARTAGSHGLGLADAIRLARHLGRLPARLVVYAVEGADFALGTGLSGPVAARVESLADHIAAEVARHARSGAGTGDPAFPHSGQTPRCLPGHGAPRA